MFQEQNFTLPIFFTLHRNNMHLDYVATIRIATTYMLVHRYCQNIEQRWKVPFTQRTEESPVKGHVNDE